MKTAFKLLFIQYRSILPSKFNNSFLQEKTQKFSFYQQTFHGIKRNKIYWIVEYFFYLILYTLFRHSDKHKHTYTHI